MVIVFNQNKTYNGDLMFEKAISYKQFILYLKCKTESVNERNQILRGYQIEIKHVEIPCLVILCYHQTMLIL